MSVPTTVIQQFLHPPIGLMRLEHVAGAPFTGLKAFDRRRPGRGTDAYGIRWIVLSSPPGYGITPGASANRFDRIVVTIGIHYQLLDGELVTVQSEESNAAAGFTLFNESFPLNVALEAAPGIEIDLWWLVILP